MCVGDVTVETVEGIFPTSLPGCTVLPETTCVLVESFLVGIEFGEFFAALLAVIVMILLLELISGQDD